MTRNLLRMIFVTLLLIFLNSCAKDIVIHQIDTVHNQANPFRIKSVNKEKCELELEALEPFPLLGPQLHGGVCVTKEDYARLKTKAKAECENAKKN